MWARCLKGSCIFNESALTATGVRSTCPCGACLQAELASLGQKKIDLGKPSANTAVACKFAHMAYFMLTRGEEFVDQGLQRNEEQQMARSVAALKRRAGAVVPYAPSDLRHGLLRLAHRHTA